jgi:diaminohydroxyphosphoribosylaminopyrimidine deaminase/5-amino-6-(5-phosphoribosylamino)uracil reductase
MTPEFFIEKTFELAKQAQGLTWPNPMVGAIFVKNNKIIGSGFHKKAGLDHAEIDALKNCSESPRGSTLYVNLEPCCHTHKTTPPCAQRLIQEGISKVVISNLDPNPEVNGKGVKLLRDHGVEVETGILENKGEKLNEVFFLSQRKKRPFVHLKLASSLDGKIALASGESQWITGEKARSHVHELRSSHQAIVIGAETLRVDNPKLNVRLANYEGVQPLRIILSRSGKLPPEASLFTDELKEKTLVFSSIEEALDNLNQKKVINVLLEGGPTLAGEFLSRGLIDRVSLYLNPSFIGEGPSLLNHFSLSRLKDRVKLTEIETSWFDEDLYLTGRILRDAICSRD